MAPDRGLVPAATWSELDALFRADPYAASLGASLVSWDGGTATVSVLPAAPHRNFLGGVHGGALFSLADLAMSYASNSWGRAALAISATVEFLAAPAGPGPLTATATERSRSRRLAAYAVDVVEDGGRLVATFSGVTFRTDRWLLGDDRWPEAWRTAL